MNESHLKSNSYSHSLHFYSIYHLESYAFAQFDKLKRANIESPISYMQSHISNNGVDHGDCKLSIQTELFFTNKN